MNLEQGCGLTNNYVPHKHFGNLWYKKETDVLDIKLFPFSSQRMQYCKMFCRSHEIPMQCNIFYINVGILYIVKDSALAYIHYIRSYSNVLNVSRHDYKFVSSLFFIRFQCKMFSFQTRYVIFFLSTILYVFIGIQVFCICNKIFSILLSLYYLNKYSC